MASVDAPATGPDPVGDPAGAPASGRPLGEWLRYARMPALLALVTAILLLWIASRPLDSIEQRQLTGDVLAGNVLEHLALAGVSTVIVVAAAVTLGVLLTRPALRRATPLAIAFANIGQATPSVGLLVLIALVAGIGFDKAVIALVAYSVLPVLRNTMVGLQQVDRSLIEAARGIGMTKSGALFRVELPLAVPVILAENRARHQRGDRDARHLHRRRRPRRHHQQRDQAGAGHGARHRRRADGGDGAVPGLAGGRDRGPPSTQGPVGSGALPRSHGWRPP